MFDRTHTFGGDVLELPKIEMIVEAEVIKAEDIKKTEKEDKQ